MVQAYRPIFHEVKTCTVYGKCITHVYGMLQQSIHVSTLVLLTGLLYVVGGCNDLGDELTSVESFNPVTKEWATLPDLNVRRSYTAVAVLEGCLYAVGGWNEADGALSSVEKLNFEKVICNSVFTFMQQVVGLSQCCGANT